MNLPAKVKQEWSKELKESGISRLSKQAKVDYRTIYAAIRSGKCRGDVFDKVNTAIIQLRADRKTNPIVKQLIESGDE